MITDKKILLVEDDANLAYLIENELNEKNAKTTVCKNATEGLDNFKTTIFDLCIFDIQLPDYDGIQLARKVKMIDQKIPLIFLTSRNLKSDQLKGYAVGADDYVTKPFDAELLLVKIKAILQRCNPELDTKIEEIKVNDFSINSIRKTLNTPKQKIGMSKTEIGILFLLFSEFKQPVSRERLMKEVWGRSDFYISKCLDVYINRVRKVLHQETNLVLRTIHAFGFTLENK